MSIPAVNKLFGKVCSCRRCFIGVVTGMEFFPDSKYKFCWTGVTLKGKPWQSNNPVILANSIQEYYDLDT